MCPLCAPAKHGEGSHFVQHFAFGEGLNPGFPSQESEKASVHVVNRALSRYLYEQLTSPQRGEASSRYEDHKVSNDFLLKRFPISGQSLSVDSLTCEPVLYLCYANSFSKVQNKGNWACRLVFPKKALKAWKFIKKNISRRSDYANFWKSNFCCTFYCTY